MHFNTKLHWGNAFATIEACKHKESIGMDSLCSIEHGIYES